MRCVEYALLTSKQLLERRDRKNCWKQPCRLENRKDKGRTTYFFLTSPYSTAPTIPTTRNASFFSFRLARTKGRLFAFPFVPTKLLCPIKSLTASTSQMASRRRVDGCRKTARSGPSSNTASRYDRVVLIDCLSSMYVPCRITARCSAIESGSADRSNTVLCAASSASVRHEKGID